MNLDTVLYQDYENGLPQDGNHILAQQKSDTLFVYQAFNASIAQYAVNNQRFGGKHYNLNRMSWIKPNFLWMMYRCGWAKKENQNRVLAIEIEKCNFEKILLEAVHSTYKEEIYKEREIWKAQLNASEVRIQWDPDHDPNGAKLARRAIQLGIKGEMLANFVSKWIVSIQDITAFVLEQDAKMNAQNIEKIRVMRESVYQIASEQLKKQLLIV
ncbi:MAG: DUF4291 domain-containing protein [Bacteroidota bacterium]